MFHRIPNNNPVFGLFLKEFLYKVFGLLRDELAVRVININFLMFDSFIEFLSIVSAERGVSHEQDI
jgi:hypothetical protein